MTQLLSYIKIQPLLQMAFYINRKEFILFHLVHKVHQYDQKKNQIFLEYYQFL